jgi:hypothetical protein
MWEILGEYKQYITLQSVKIFGGGIKMNQSIQKLIEEIHYFRLPVIELDDSIRWYTECLGLEED